jgi:choline-glycine betaine transporter
LFIGVIEQSVLFVFFGFLVGGKSVADCSPLSALPFSIIILAMCYSFYKSLNEYSKEKNTLADK